MQALPSNVPGQLPESRQHSLVRQPVQRAFKNSYSPSGDVDRQTLNQRPTDSNCCYWWRGKFNIVYPETKRIYLVENTDDFKEIQGFIHDIMEQQQYVLGFNVTPHESGLGLSRLKSRLRIRVGRLSKSDKDQYEEYLNHSLNCLSNRGNRRGNDVFVSIFFDFLLEYKNYHSPQQDVRSVYLQKHLYDMVVKAKQKTEPISVPSVPGYPVTVSGELYMLLARFSQILAGGLDIYLSASGLFVGEEDMFARSFAVGHKFFSMGIESKLKRIIEGFSTSLNHLVEGVEDNPVFKDLSGYQQSVELKFITTGSFRLSEFSTRSQRLYKIWEDRTSTDEGILTTVEKEELSADIKNIFNSYFGGLDERSPDEAKEKIDKIIQFLLTYNDDSVESPILFLKHRMALGDILWEDFKAVDGDHLTFKHMFDLDTATVPVKNVSFMTHVLRWAEYSLQVKTDDNFKKTVEELPEIMSSIRSHQSFFCKESETDWKNEFFNELRPHIQDYPFLVCYLQDELIAMIVEKDEKINYRIKMFIDEYNGEFPDFQIELNSASKQALKAAEYSQKVYSCGYFSKATVDHFRQTFGHLSSSISFYVINQPEVNDHFNGMVGNSSFVGEEENGDAHRLYAVFYYFGICNAALQWRQAFDGQ